MKYFCIIKEKIACMECLIKSSMFYSFYLFLSILLFNEDSALVSDMNALFFVLLVLSWKKNIWERKEISLLLLLSSLNPRTSLFIVKEVGWGVCAERDITQEGSCEQPWQRVTVEGRWAKKGNFNVT